MVKLRIINVSRQFVHGDDRIRCIGGGQIYSWYVRLFWLVQQRQYQQWRGAQTFSIGVCINLRTCLLAPRWLELPGVWELWTKLILFHCACIRAFIYGVYLWLRFDVKTKAISHHSESYIRLLCRWWCIVLAACHQFYTRVCVSACACWFRHGVPSCVTYIIIMIVWFSLCPSMCMLNICTMFSS